MFLSAVSPGSSGFPWVAVATDQLHMLTGAVLMPSKRPSHANRQSAALRRYLFSQRHGELLRGQWPLFGASKKGASLELPVEPTSLWACLGGVPRGKHLALDACMNTCTVGGWSPKCDRSNCAPWPTESRTTCGCAEPRDRGRSLSVKNLKALSTRKYSCSAHSFELTGARLGTRSIEQASGAYATLSGAKAADRSEFSLSE